MSTRGNYSSTSGRKTDSVHHNQLSYGSKTIFFAHQASSGDTHIDLTSLSMPTNLLNKGYSNPTTAELQSLHLSFNKSKLKIISSDRGELMKISFSVPNNMQISFDGFTANADEIFECTFEPNVITGTTVVDAVPYVKTYDLAEGETDVITDPFEYYKFPDMQVGAVMVFRGTTQVLQLRNVNNATAAPTADGNYQEISANDGYSNTIRFNVAAAAGGETITIISVGSLVERPTESMMNYLETMNGSLDKVIEVLATVSGKAESYFEAQPMTTDLSAFSSKVNNIDDLLADNYLGSENSAIDKSSAGRGILLRSPDGTLYEITIKDGGGDFDIYEIS